MSATHIFSQNKDNFFLFRRNIKRVNMKTFAGIQTPKEIDSEMWKYILRFQGKSEIMARLGWLDGLAPLLPPATDNLWGSQTIFDGNSRLGSPSNLLV